MKRRMESLIGFTISGKDGEMGKVKEFYFDDETWTVRYMIVETGSWLFGRKVLIAPEAVNKIDLEQKMFKVNLTIEQVQNSPMIDTDKPVSRQHEMLLYSHYLWKSFYWGGGAGSLGMGMSYPISIYQDKKEDVISDDDIHLRSTEKVTGYSIKASDGRIGDVEDFIINDSTWAIDLILIDTGNWFPGKKVLISPKLIKEVNWENSTVTVNATEAQVKNSPEYDPGEELSDAYQSNLQNYYGRFISHK